MFGIFKFIQNLLFFYFTVSSSAAAMQSHASKTSSPVTIETRRPSMSPPTATSPYNRVSPQSLPSPAQMKQHSPHMSTANNSWVELRKTTVPELPLNLSKPRSDIKTERVDDGYNLAMEDKREAVVTPPPAHSNHRRQTSSSTPPAEVTSFVGVRSPFGLPHYVTSPYMMGNHLQMSAMLNNLTAHSSVLNGKSLSSESDKVGLLYYLKKKKSRFLNSYLIQLNQI